MRNLILTGFMGSGKTTVARILARRYGLELVDTDEELERRAGCTIAEFWSRHEEPAFRDLEHDAFRELLADGGGRVIASGAGTLTFERNRALLSPEDAVVCLDCSTEELVRRLHDQRGTRPLLAGLEDSGVTTYVKEKLASRRPIYDLFRQVDTSGRSPEEIAAQIADDSGLPEADCLQFDSRRESNILFGQGLLGSLGRVLAQRGLHGQVLLVHDFGVRNSRWPIPAMNSLRDAEFTFHHASIFGGESEKTLATVETIYRRATALELDRSAIVIGIGGGVVGDIAGMVAATYLRGLRLVLVPTTLLAQVDAAIGGKVGVDLEGIKNMIGAFYPADIVLIDPETLTTLPESGVRNGLAEIVKIAFVRSLPLLEQVEQLAAPAAILDHPEIIRRAALEKARLVRLDPYERGDRALLNFGHTIGHALETHSDFRLSHGNAVSAGMVAETWLAERKGICPVGTLERLTTILVRFGLATAYPGANYLSIIALMRNDKKRRDGKIRIAVPVSAGEGATVELSDAEVEEVAYYAIRKIE